jgi:dynein heavy chain 1
MSSSTTLLRAAISVGSIESQTAAEQALSQAMRTGGWVLLRNVHLASVWAEQALRKAMASLIEGEGSGSGSTIVIHPTFRAILTIEVPILLVSKSSSSQVSSMPRIPEQLLQESSKALIETPTGLRNALIRSALSLNSLTQKKEKPSSLETFSLRDRLLQLIVWVHATLLERRRFVAAGCGWSKSYDFCDADLTCALATVDTIISQQGLTALPTTIQAREAILKELSFMLLQAVHGARLETDTDALEFKNILDRVFVAAAIEDKSTHSLSADTAVRATLSSELSLLAWAESVVLDNVKPSVVGLMDNAEEGLLKTEAKHLLNKVETLSQL